MNIDAIAALAAQDEVGPPAWRAVAPAPEGTGFLQSVTQGLQEVNQQLLTSQGDLQRLAVGAEGNLHETMVRLEESRISLQLLLQVRNRVLEAYQDLMRMQL